MNTYRNTAIVVGVLYIMGTAAGVLSAVFTGPIFGASDYLSKVAANANQLTLAALLVLFMGLALAMIPALLFPIFRKLNEVLAVGYVVFRGALEAGAAIATVITWFFLMIAGREYVAAGAPVDSTFQALGAVFLKGTDPISALGGIVFGLGALMLYYVFYQSQLIPRWISVWGFIAIPFSLSANILILFGLQSSSSTADSAMHFPIFLQEMVMAVWLIVRGFNPSAIASLHAKMATNEPLSAS